MQLRNLDQVIQGYNDKIVVPCSRILGKSKVVPKVVPKVVVKTSSLPQKRVELHDRRRHDRVHEDKK